MIIEQYKLDKLGEEYKLNLEDRLVFEDGLIGFEIVYAGQPTKDTFSLLCTRRELFLNRMQGNLFFPVNQKNLKLDGRELEVLAVDNSSILLKHIK